MKRLLAARSSAVRSARRPRGGAAPTRSATSPSTASRASRSPATGCTSATSSTSPRSRPSRSGSAVVDADGLRRRSSRADRPRPRRVDGRPARPAPLAHALAFPPGAGGLRTLRFEAVYARPAGRRPGAARASRHELRAAGSAGRRSSSGRSGRADLLSRRPRPSSATSSAPTRRTSCSSPLDVTAAHASTSSRATAPGSLRRRARPTAARVQARPADGGFAGLIAQDDLGPASILASLADRALLGRRARALAGSRQGDRRRVPGRPARDGPRMRSRSARS